MIQRKSDFCKLRKEQKKYISGLTKKCYESIREVINNNPTFNQNIYQRVGYEVVGPMLYGYVTWLHEQAKTEEANCILFLSREGYLLRNAYIDLFGETSGMDLSYIYVSRVSMAKATFIYNQSWDDFEDRCATLFRGLSTVDELATLLGIEIRDADYSSLGLMPESKIDEINDKTNLFKVIKSNGYSFFEEQNKIFVNYLTENGVGKGKTIIADIGWSGTMQILFCDLFPDETFVGCYLAVSDTYRSEKYKQIDRRGFWFGTEEFYGKWKMIRFTIAALEFLFLGNEGTTLEYKIENNKIIAIKQIESNAPGKYIEQTHEAAINFVRDYDCVGNSGRFEGALSDVWFIPYQNFAVFPNTETLLFFGNFTMVNGVTEYGFLPLKSKKYYLFHPKQLLRELELSNGKVIWLYGLLRLPLPYFRILCFLTYGVGMKSNFEKKYLTNNAISD